MLELGQAQQEIRVVNDQVSVPTWSRTLAEAVTVIATQLLGQRDGWADKTGTYHLAGKGRAALTLGLHLPEWDSTVREGIREVYESRAT